jgi:ABC-type transport system involved in multi-copper enzyme maturation permease subunit
VTRAIRIELLKIRTTRLPLGLLGVASALTLLVTVVESTRAGVASGGGVPIPELSTVDGLRTIVTNTGFGTLVATVFGAIVTSGEFRHKTATDTYIDEPNRGRILMAKIITAAIAGAGFGLAATLIATTVGLAFATTGGDGIALTAQTIGGYAAGATVAAGLMAAVGAGVGALIRSQLGALIVVFGWSLAVEQIVGGVSAKVAPYLPITAASTMAGAASEAAMPPIRSGLDALPPAAVVALLTGLTVIITAVAAHSTVRRDIS